LREENLAFHWIKQGLAYYLVGLFGFHHLWEKILATVFKSETI